MKKIFYAFLLLIFIIASCSKPKTDQEQIKKQILEYKKQLSELNSKIAELEALLVDSTEVNKGIYVKILTIESQKFEHYFEANATVEAINDAFISPQYNGQIQKIYVQEGDRVTKGQLLAELNSEILKNSVVEIQNALDLATMLYKKQEELWKQNIGSEVQYLQAKNAKEGLEKSLVTLNSQIELTKVKAPFAGIVDDIYQKEGELGVPGVKLLQLVNLNELYVNADVSESYLAKIKVSDPVTLTFPSYPDIKIETTIFQKGNVIQSANRTFNVKVKITNTNELIKPNLMANIYMKDYETDSAILVPTVILNKDVNGQFVYITEESEGKYIARKRYIKIGQSNNEHTEVFSGLEAGEKIITDGYNVVKDGTNITF